jgi:hypothetical protein
MKEITIILTDKGVITLLITYTYLTRLWINGINLDYKSNVSELSRLINLKDYIWLNIFRYIVLKSNWLVDNICIGER